jgi:hypothetical protein
LRFKPFLNGSPQNAGMLRNDNLQILGPASVVGAIMCAVIGAHALASWPTSSALWYLNLEVFRSFRYSFEGITFINWFDTDGLAQSICVATVLLGLIFTGLTWRNRLPFGIASNLSLIYSAALVYSSIVEYGTAAGVRMNLNGLATPAGLLALTILILSFWSTAISHRSYWRDIFA